MRVEKLLEGAQTRGLDTWSVATKVLRDGPRSLENLSDAQVAEAQSRGIELRELLKTARYSEAARQDLVDRYGLTIDPSIPDDPQALLETMLHQGFVKDDLLWGIDWRTQQRRLYPDALLQQIAQRNAAIMQVGFSHEAWLHLPNGRAQRIEGRTTEDVAQMEAALITAAFSHEEANADLKKRSKLRHPVQQALDEHPEVRGELIWNNSMTWLDGGSAKLVAGLPNALLDSALVGGMSYAQTYTGEMLKGTENSSREELLNHLLNPLSLMEAYDEASRKGFVSGTISAASMFLGANLVVKVLGGASMAGRVVMGAGGSAGMGGAAMALDQLNTKGKVDWTEIGQVIPDLFLLGLLGTGKVRTPGEIATTLKTAIPEIKQQAVKTWTGELHGEVQRIRQTGVPAEIISDYLSRLLKGSEQEVVYLPSGILRSFLEGLAIKEPDVVNAPKMVGLWQRLDQIENTPVARSGVNVPVDVPLADLLPYLSDVSTLLEKGHIGRVGEIPPSDSVLAIRKAYEGDIPTPSYGRRSEPFNMEIINQTTGDMPPENLQHVFKSPEYLKGEEIAKLSGDEMGISDRIKQGGVPYDAIQKLPRKKFPGKQGRIKLIPGAIPDGDELTAAHQFTAYGYDVTIRRTASSLGIPGVPTCDFWIDGLGRVDVYTPQSKKLDSIKEAIRKKQKQTDATFINTRLSSDMMYATADKIWKILKETKGKPVPNIRKLFFRDLEGNIVFIERPKDK